MSGEAPAPLPRVGVSLGDPCGIGPEITVRALADPGLRSRLEPVVFGDPAVWWRAVDVTGSDPELPVLEKGAAPGTGGGMVPVTDLGDHAAPFGGATDASDHAQRAYLEAAVEALAGDTVDALCTAPVTKAALGRTGLPFPGHTEFLAERLGAGPVAMMLAGPRLRVALVSIHIPVAEVPGAVTEARVVEVGRLAASALRDWFRVSDPCLAICGLNPHAGEGGRFGREEIDAISPAIERLAGEGIAASGPHAADAVMARAAAGAYDAVVAMYHDQGLGPIKTLHPDDAVNVTLGLPKPRTSPDHGTALDIAGQGIARAEPMVAALGLAADLARRGPATGRRAG